jgi:hypothetical protein
MKIKSFKDIQDMPVEVRVLDSTNSPTEETKAMIGGIFERCGIDGEDGTVNIWNKDKSDWFWFNFSDIQYLTPVFHKGYQIGIGDRVWDDDEEYEVFGYSWVDGQWVIDCATIEDGEPNYSYTTWLRESEITSVTPLYKQDDEIDKAIKLLEKAGRIRNGRVIT